MKENICKGAMQRVDSFNLFIIAVLALHSIASRDAICMGIIMIFETEFAFTLPKGYRDAEGNIHKDGRMRLANAADEILPLKDPKVQQNPGYLTIILLTRVITRLGDLPHVDTQTVEKLYTADLAYLQDFYQRINAVEEPVYECVCPNCGKQVKVPVNFMDAAY